MCASIPERLRELQGSRSAEEFANAIGVSRQTVTYWFNESRKPSADNIRTICEREKCNANWLLGFDVPKTQDHNIQMIAEHTGLSEGSIDALHSMAHGNDSLCRDDKGIDMLNIILEAEQAGIYNQTEFVKDHPALFDSREAHIGTIFDTIHRLVFLKAKDHPLSDVFAEIFKEARINETDLTRIKCERTLLDYVNSLRDMLNEDAKAIRLSRLSDLDQDDIDYLLKLQKQKKQDRKKAVDDFERTIASMKDEE